VFLNYILHWGALRFYALLKGALTEKSLRKADLADTFIQSDFQITTTEAAAAFWINCRGLTVQARKPAKRGLL